MANTERLAQLRENLVEHFDLDELRTLCFDLGVKYDDLGGEGITAKARDLITVMLRQNRLAELAYTLQAQRPNVEWPNVEALSPEERLAWMTATEMQSAADYLAALRDYCASLPYLSLHDIRPPKTLDEVYVPLKARPQPREGEKQERDEERAMRERQRSEPLSIAEVMRQREQPHVLILGEPGAGKSTLLRQMAERAWDAPDKIGLEAPCLPILIPLRRLAELDGSLEERLHRALTGELALTQDLSQGFFTRWPDQTGANWLLLLDALDEVPAEQRPRLMDWFKRMLKTVGPNRIVITSRPSGYSPGELDDELFGHYELLPFTPEQTGEFAHKWFGDRAGSFLQELERIRASALSGTPLLLTVGAKVYMEKGALPERRSALYGQFVDIWSSEAEGRGLRDELGERTCKVAKFGLAQLALAMIEHPGQVFDTALSQIASAYLRDALQLSSDEAEADGRHFVQVIARRSGVFTRHGTAHDFIHPTFREYLAACACVQECRQGSGYDLEQVWQRVVSRWMDKNWREVALFALGILSDAELDVTVLVKRTWRKGKGIFSIIWDEDVEGLRFAGIALAEQVKVETSLSNDIIDALLARARKEQWWDWSITLLGDLHDYPRAGEGLLAQARDEKGEEVVRVFAAEALGRSGRAEEAVAILLALACDEKVYYVRQSAAEVLGHLGRAEDAVSIWLALARDEKVNGLARVRAAEALGRLGRAGEAASILLALVRDEKLHRWVYWQVLEQAAEVLGRLGRDKKVNVLVRVDAAQALGRLRRTEDAASILLALAHDEKVDGLVRVDAAQGLGRLRRAEDAAPILLALARDEKVDGLARVRAAQGLGRLGRAEEAASILLALARDEKVNGLARVRAAEALGHLGRAENAVSILLALALDEKVHGRVPVDAAQALGELWRAEGAASILLALARDEKVDEQVRAFAAYALGQSADARILPGLEHIAQEDKARDVRRAAQQAIEQIRRRV